MSSTLVYDAVKARLVDQLGGTYPIRDWEEIETALQRETAAWISIEDSGGANELNSVGSPSSNWVTDNGFIDVHALVPSTGGLSPARVVAEQIRTALMFQQFTLTEGHLRTLTVEPPDTGYIHNGLWHSMRVTMNYSHQYARPTAA